MRVQSKKFYFIVATMLLIGGFSELLRAQSATNTAVPFLLISPGSRASAMGEEGVAISDDASAIYWNPAGLGFQNGQEMSLTHSNWLPQFNQSDLFYENGNYKVHIPKISGTLGASLQFLSLGKFERRDEANVYLGEFSSFELALTTAYGTKLDEDIAVGLGLKLIYSSLSQLGTAHEQGSGTVRQNSRFPLRMRISSIVSLLALPFQTLDLPCITSMKRRPILFRPRSDWVLHTIS